MKISKKLILLGTSLILLATSVFAKDVVYISPNNDGIQDELVIPLTIKDKRFISEWQLVICDESGAVVKTIGNKNRADDSAKTFFRSLTQGESFKDFFKNVGKAFSPKKGIEVPSQVRWNGVLENGEVAKDGKYTYYFVAVDDNGNRAQTKSYEVIVDNTPPKIELVQPRESDKIFGAGSKPVLKIVQSGSVEDLWKGVISDSNGNAVRSFIWENASPVTIEWDGKDDNEIYVSEGVYSYQISSTDRAGNTSAPAVVSNIIYDAIPRTANINIEGSPFSPNGDGVKDALTVNISVPNQNGMTSWKIQVLDAKGKAVKTYSGSENVPEKIIYDGTNDSGTLIDDGKYQFALSVEYNNGQNPKSVKHFEMDTIAPRAQVKASSEIFSPDGDGVLDVISISQLSTSKESLWNGRIVSQDGTTVKSWSFVGIPPETVEWNGIDANGNFAKDGLYFYELSCTDEAGNSSTFTTDMFELDTSKTEIALHCEYEAFSPYTIDHSQDTICFVPIVKSSSEIEEYWLTIKNEKGSVVKEWHEQAMVKDVFEWNGLDNEGVRLPDGVYSVELKTRSRNGSSAFSTLQHFEIDSTFPVISEFAGDNLVFSPNGDGKKDELTFTMKTSDEDAWNFAILDKDGNVVLSKTWQTRAENFVWDGTDANGSQVTDGVYSAVLSSTDKAGNKSSATISGITVDTRNVKAYLTMQNDAFSPNATGEKSVQIFDIMVTPNDGIESWKVSVLDSQGKCVKVWQNSAENSDLPSQIKWAGYLDAKEGEEAIVADGTYIAKLDLVYTKGDEISVSTSSFICEPNAPQLKVMMAPKYFSPDNDGVDDDLFIKLKAESKLAFTSWSFEIKEPVENGRTFWKTEGNSTITERLIWDGRSNSGELVQSATDYPYVFTVTDAIGQTSTIEGVVPVDVLVIREGDVLRILIPSIIFRSDNADFLVTGEKDSRGNVVSRGITQEQKANNERVLKRIAEILNKFKDYNIVIEGHANNISGTQEEEEKELLPLSQKRAEYVLQRLTKYGVQSSRLTAVGKGGTRPVAPANDRNVNWKNRRVEFILEK